MAMVGVESSSL